METNTNDMPDFGNSQSFDDFDFDFNLPAGTSADTNMSGNQANAGADQINGGSNPMTFDGNGAAVTRQGLRPDSWFWDARNSMVLQDGLIVMGINSELWDEYKDLRMPLVGLFNSGQTTFEAQPMANSHYPAPSMPMQANSYPQGPAPAQSHGVFSPSSGYPSANVSPQFTTPTPAPATPATTSTGTKRKRATPTPGMSLPAYQPSADLRSADDARQYLSRHDSNEAQQLDIPDDDVDQVKGKLHIYAARIYRALLSPYEVLPDDDDRKEKHTEQQENAMASLQKMLKTPTQLKVAQASCILLIDAAIAVHENGVSRECFDKQDFALLHNHRVDASYRVSLDLTCSERVEGLIAAVKANKLVGKDVLEQKNLLRFAESPDAYAKRKLAYLRSNKTRQDKCDERAEQDLANGITGRKAPGRRAAKKTKYAEEAEDEDDEFFL